MNCTNLKILFELDPEASFNQDPFWVHQHDPFWIATNNFDWLKQNKHIFSIRRHLNKLILNGLITMGDILD